MRMSHTAVPGLMHRSRAVLRWLSLIAVSVTAVLGFAAVQLWMRRQFLLKIEHSGAVMFDTEITKEHRWRPNALQPGLLVRSASWLHHTTGLGEPQRVIRSITANGSRFRDDHFRFLRAAGEIKHLDFAGSQITDTTVSRVASLRNLTTMDLSYTNVTDESLESLTECDALRRLSVNSTDISRDAIEQFCRQRPSVAVRWCPPSSEQDRQAIRELLACGAYLRYFRGQSVADSSRPVAVYIRRRRNVDHAQQTACLEHLIGLSNTSFLVLQWLSLSESETAVLERLTNVTSLRLENVRAPHFRWLASLKSLQSIQAMGRVPGDEILEYVRQLPQLRSVAVENVSDNSAALLGQNHQIQTITLQASRIGEDTIDAWSELSNLQRLELQNAGISNRTLEKIASFRSLDRLDLSHNPIEDDALVHLRQLTNLRTLNLSDTNVTPAGFAHLISLSNLRELWWVPEEEEDSEHDELLEITMDILWRELALASDEQLPTIVAMMVKNNEAAFSFSLDGRPIDPDRPDEWMSALLDHLAPVRAFRLAVPDCRLR